MRSVFERLNYTSESLAAAVGGKPVRGGNRPLGGIVTDSREVLPGDVFLAIRGETMDGHAFAGTADARGCGAVVCDHMPEGVERADVILVEDTTKALGALAHDARKRLALPLIAVTGSVGKTTTKEFIAAVLSEAYHVHKTDGNHNNEIGLPMTLLATPKDADVIVLEMGMSARGEIAHLSKIAEPDLAVITTIGTSHIEHLGSRENIRDAKMEITEGLRPGGTLIVSGDEKLLRDECVLRHAPLYVGIEDERSVLRGENLRFENGKTRMDVVTASARVCDVELPTLGAHQALDALYAIAVGRIFGLDEEQIRRGLSAFRNTGMRQHTYKIGDVTVIEDCYNASPESMIASLGILEMTVSERKGARALALLGDMRELGEMTRVSHEKVGADVAARHIDRLFTFGAAATGIADGARAAGMPSAAIDENPDITDPRASAQAIADVLRPHDVLLVKASRATQAERVIEELKKIYP